MDKITGKLPKPRHKILNDLLRTKRCEAHEPKAGDHTNRARSKQQHIKNLRQEGFLLCGVVSHKNCCSTFLGL